jgi:hypothetical protein
VRIIPGVVLLLFLMLPAPAASQSVLVHGSAGPTMGDAGHSFAVGAGFSPGSHATLLVDVERTHMSSRVRNDGRGGVSAFRGGTLTMGAAELRVTLLGRDRITPYGLAGFGAGVSRPNVNEIFPEPRTNAVRAIFFGGGIQVPLGQQFSIFADARMMIGGEAGESLAVAPLRVGLAWRF